MQCARVNLRRLHTVEHSMEFTKFLYHEFLKNFREKNFFGKHFTVKLISRNYTQVMIQKFRKLNTVWKLQKFSLALFHKNFVKSMVLQKKLPNS